MEDSQQIGHTTDVVNDETSTGRSISRDLPPLFYQHSSEGNGRVLRYRSGFNPHATFSQPLIRHSADVSSPLESRNHDDTIPEVECMSNVTSSSEQTPHGVAVGCRMPISTVNSSNSHAGDFITDVDGETSLDHSPQIEVITQSNSHRSEHTQPSIQCAYFTIGAQDDTQTQVNMSNGNDLVLHINPTPPPSYEVVCQKKFVRDSTASSHNTVDSLQPPTYRDAVGRGRYLEDAPPNYQTLFAHSVFRMMDLTNDIVGQVDDIEERSCCSQVITYVLLSGIVIFVAGMAVPLPFAMIIIGVTHLHSCPAQPRIPVFLTSLGVFQLLECLGRLSMYIYSKLRSHTSREDARYRSKDPFVYFIVVWFVVGSMWVYQNYPSCHEVIPQDTDTLRTSSFHNTGFSGNKTVHATNPINYRKQNALLYKTTLRPTIVSDRTHRSSLQGVVRTSNHHPLTWPTTPNMVVNVNRQDKTSLPTTAGVPEERQEAACCGRVVYFFTFGIVTLYYSLVGILFLLQVCSGFANLVCKCRRQTGRA